MQKVNGTVPVQIKIAVTSFIKLATQKLLRNVDAPSSMSSSGDKICKITDFVEQML